MEESSQQDVIKELHIYTDGSCSPNPGFGAWGCVLVNPDTNLEIARYSGVQSNTTNNVMEMMGVYKALEESLQYVDTSYSIRVFTDSQYAQRGLTEWLKGWKLKNWKNSQGKPVLNRDLWELLDSRVSTLEAAGWDLVFQWVRGHNGNQWNEVVDSLVNQLVTSRQHA